MNLTIFSDIGRVLGDLIQVATAMVRDAMTAFSRGDAALPDPVWEKDKEFDALYSHVFPNLITSLAKDPERAGRSARPARRLKLDPALRH